MDPRSNKVIVVEPTPLPLPIKLELAKSLLEDLMVPSITFFPGSVMSLLTLGKMEGLTINFGSVETTITPVFDCRPLESLSISSSLGNESLKSHLRDLLIKCGSYSILTSSEDSSPKSQSFTPAILGSSLCQHIIDNFIFASPLSPPKTMLNQDPNNPMADYGIFCDNLMSWYQQSSIASDLFFDWRLKNSSVIRCFIPGFVREHVLDILFCGDSKNDINGIVDLTCQTIRNLPVDLKKRLTSQVLVTGNLPRLPNFRTRFITSLAFELSDNPKTKALSSIASLLDDISHNSSNGADFISQTDDGYNQLNKDLTEDLDAESDIDSIMNESKEKKYKNSGLTFDPSNRCWIGASIAVSSKMEGQELDLNNFLSFFSGAIG
ncbi:Actin-related protein 10, partial [Smittium culicis]